ncbi:molybdopterin oxidoreductase family protein [Lyngbya confervoides]|uniref:Nitrate reductase n=1 Tax=Lyngbya confervoides BDU141951 TaxID=1574623 RepID=A0ABD4T4X5_9CYAN|nr:nitrate reductase [Lyngbya confervoides]MCM1983486.1 nitrate reductase [Lyngbya confervoides BDU141951]
MTAPVKTLCPYCGVGCGLEVLPPALPGKTTSRDDQGNLLWRVRGDRDHPSSKGQVCVKGATIASSLDKDRLLHPMMRDRLDEPFRQVSWEEALERIVTQIKTVQLTQGPEAICMYGSGQFQTEDYYTAQKLLKGCIGTNNFDANSRLCMSSAVAGYIQSFGSDGPPTCYDDLEQTDCAFLIGTNTAECHPIVFNRLRKHHKGNRKVKMIVVDPRRTPTAAAADLHLAIRPGTDMHLLNGIAHLLMRWGMYDGLFVDECTQGFPEYSAVIEHYPPELVARECGIRLDELEQAARYWGKSERVLSLWSMGVNQSSEGTAKVRTIINLHLMTGNIGKPGAGPFSLTGQPNAMGGREAGGLAHILPGYRLVKNPEHRSAVEQVWQVPPGSIADQPGLSAWEMIEGLEQGQVGLFWVAATNPAVSMPDLERTKAALLKSPFTICQDAYYPTETAAYAHVLLPAAQFGEKTGTMTNSERVVTLCQAFRPPVGEARADWEIFAEVGRRLGFTSQFAAQSAAEVYDEFVSLTRDRLCDMTGLSHGRLAELGPVQWPFPAPSAAVPSLRDETGEESPSSPPEVRQPRRLYESLEFATPDKRARFAAFHAKGLAEPPNPDYPFVLTTGRLYGHWHTQSRTGRIPKTAEMHPKPFLEVHPKDAEKIGLSPEGWVEVISPRGRARLAVKVTPAIAPGTVFMPMHWGFLWADGAEVNALTHPEACPISLEPELKACAVRLVAIAPQSESGWTDPQAHRDRVESLVKAPMGVY